MFTWAVHVFKAPYQPIAKHNGLDSFMFIRFLRMVIKMFVPMWLVSWAILFPVDSANSGGGESGLNMFTYGNISTSNHPRYATHLLISWLFTCKLALWINFEHCSQRTQ